MITKTILRDIENDILPEFSTQIAGLEGKTILITGGNSLLASYLVDSFVLVNKTLTNKINLIIINKNPITEESRLSHLIGDNNIKFISQDLSKDFEVPGKPNIIIHAASRANIQSFKEDPLDTINANIKCISTLLEYAKDNPVEQFIFFSSGEIYGNPFDVNLQSAPTPETFTPLIMDSMDVRSCYINAKRISETLGRAYHEQHSVPFKAARIILGYGPGIRSDGKVITDFIDSALNTGEITIWDHGDATRVFSYVSDVARALFYILFNGEQGEAYNIGGNNNEIISMKELADKIAEIVSSIRHTNITVRPNIKNKPLRKIPDTRNLDITKIKSLGFHPKINLEQGLGRLLEHYQETGKIK